MTLCDDSQLLLEKQQRECAQWKKQAMALQEMVKIKDETIALLRNSQL
jgi:hypothetical protein